MKLVPPQFPDNPLSAQVGCFRVSRQNEAALRRTLPRV